MLGFTSDAESIELAVNTDEVEMAGWFTREEIGLFER